MRRHVALLMAAVVACVLCVGMTGCGPTKQETEKQIESALTADLDEIKAVDAKVIEGFSQGLGDQVDLSRFGITEEQYCKALLNGFDYKVNSVTVSDNTAVASVDITTKDFNAAVTAWMSSLGAIATDTEFISAYADKTPEEIEQGLYAKAGSLLLTSLNQAGTKTVTVELPYQLNDQVWEPANGSDQVIAEAVLGDLSSLNL